MTVNSMNRNDEIRQKAAEAQELADQSVTEADRESWQGVAQAWLSRLNEPQSPAEQRFDEQLITDGTKQQASTKLH